MRLYTPLRYPGGKGKIYEDIKKLIVGNSLESKTYVEPFAGSFAIGIGLLSDGIVEKAILNDYDYHIYAFWRSVFFKTNDLIKNVIDLPITVEEWKRQKAIYATPKKQKYLDVGIATLFLNRTNFSGIIKGGPIGGMHQTGKYSIDCRFNKRRICDLILNISKLKNRIKLSHLDAKVLIKNLVAENWNEYFIYFDPPYVKNGKSLYANYYTSEDHKMLGKIIHKDVYSDWIMTYDDDELVRKIYFDCVIRNFGLKYSANTNKNGDELLIMPKRYRASIFGDKK